jgi:WXG100 family type VII secretion target
MQKAAQQVQQVSQEIQQQINSLDSQLEAVAGGWQGSAASAFTQLMARFKEDANKLSQALGNIAETMDSSTKNYSQQESDATSSITKLLGSLS